MDRIKYLLKKYPEIKIDMLNNLQLQKNKIINNTNLYIEKYHCDKDKWMKSL